MKTWTHFGILIALLLSTAVAAQEIRIGSLEGNNRLFVSSPVTLIDWTRGATGNGTVNTASVAWTDASVPCDNIFFVRFFGIPSNAFAIVMTAERGPFRAVNGINTVALDPPVNVTSETYIGIRRAAGPDTCGKPYGTFTRVPSRALFAGDDFKGGAFTTLNPLSNYRLQAMASNVPSVRVATIPIVGAAPGAAGSFFRTALTLTNPSGLEIRGKLVFHPAGTAATSTDPSLDYTIPANGTLNYPDIIAAMNQAGLGSLDILTTASPTLIANARVFNDNGAAGTSGLTEDAVTGDATGFPLSNIFIPQDSTNFRLNIGIRTFTAGTVNIAIVDASGLQVNSLARTYPANYFEHVSASVFVDGNALPPGGKIVISSFQSNFVAYGSVTDNHTNDPTMRIGTD